MLNKIIQIKEHEVKMLKKYIPKTNMIKTNVSGTNDFITKQNHVKIIAEIKKASPVKGNLNFNLDPITTAISYAQNGAASISVLTDHVFFKGDVSFITEVKGEVNLPILRKDFIIDEIQLYESLAIGADMVLLIASILPYTQLLNLIEKCNSLCLEPLVEVHSESEAQMIADLPVRIAGINNRNLADFTVDINHSLRLVNYIPNNIFKVSESGISQPADLLLLEKHGFNAALIGETLVTSSSPGLKLKELLSYQEDTYD